MTRTRTLPSGAVAVLDDNGRVIQIRRTYPTAQQVADGEAALQADLGPDRLPSFADLADLEPAAPPVALGTSHTGRLATERQVQLIRLLYAERYPELTLDQLEEVAAAAGKMTVREASTQIERLRSIPKAVAEHKQPGSGTPSGEDLEDGMYRRPNGEVVKVYVTVHGASQRVAKVLRVLDDDERYTKTLRGREVEVRAEFEYAGKRGLRGLTPEMRMTFEEAVEFGAIYGVCCVCSATLTNETSIELGIGPVCRRRV